MACSAGIENIVRMAEKFHFGEHTGLPTRQETPGIFPTLTRCTRRLARRRHGEHCIGQGEMAVTPMQMAVAYAAIANGGTVFWPRLVEQIEPQDPVSGETVDQFSLRPRARQLGVSARSLNILRDAMLAETEDPEGTGRPRRRARPADLRQDRHGAGDGHAQPKIDRKTWFASFAPYENPHYAVVVMVENRQRFGGTICAPIAHDIYEEILKSETSNAPALTAARSGERMN